MSDRGSLDNLKQEIVENIYTNENQAVTGDLLQDVLIDAVDTMGVSVSQNTETGKTTLNVGDGATIIATDEQVVSLADFLGKYPPMFKQEGFYIYLSDSNTLSWYSYSGFVCKFTPVIKCQKGEHYFYKGGGQVYNSNFRNIIFYNNGSIVSTLRFTGYNGVGMFSNIFEIPDGIDSFVAVSANYGDDAGMDLYQINESSVSNVLTNDILPLHHNFIADYYFGNGVVTQATGSASKYTDVTFCKEGDIFHYKGIAKYATTSVWFFNNETFISSAQYNGEFDITIPSGVNNVLFASWGEVASTPDDVALVAIKPKSLSDVNKKIEELQNKTSSLDTIQQSAYPVVVFKGYMGNNGAIYITGDVNSQRTDKIECSERDVFEYTGNSNNAICYGIALYNNDTIVGVSSVGTSNPVWSQTMYVKIPSGVNYVQFVSYDSDNNPLIVKKIVGSMSDKLIELDIDIKGIPTHRVNGRYMTSSTDWNSIVGCDSLYTDRLLCQSGDVFHYKGVGEYSTVSWVFLNGSTVVGSGKYVGECDVVVPSEIDGTPVTIDHIMFASYGAPTDVYLEVSRKDTAANKLNKLYSQIQGNCLYGKKWVACGDSFTQGDFSGLTDQTQYKFQDEPYKGKNKVYPYYIGRRNNMRIVNEALSGSIMALSKAYIDDPTNVPIDTRSPFSYQRYLSEEFADADYITLWFGINDAANTYLGTIEDNTNETFYGAWNVVLEYFITHYTTAKIGIVITNGTGSETYKQATRDVALKWGIPFLDMTKDPQVPPIFERDASLGYSSVAQQIRTEAFRVTSTNGHPNAKAHEFESYFIENWLRSL